MLCKRSLRILIVVDLILIVISGIVSIVGEAWLPEQLQAFEQARAEADATTSDWVLMIVGVPLVIAVLMSFIGLLVFWHPARPLYFATLVAAALPTPFGGSYVTPGWAQAIDSVSSIVSGVLLAVIYFSPLRELYNRPQKAA